MCTAALNGISETKSLFLRIDSVGIDWADNLTVCATYFDGAGIRMLSLLQAFARIR